MIQSTVSIVLLALLIITIGCSSSRRWTPEQRNDFESKCTARESVEYLDISFRGFDDKAFDSVVVKEYDNKKLVSTFNVPVPPARDKFDRDARRRFAKIDRPVNLKHTYEISVPGQRPYRLANMKMITWPQYTMNSEGWGCVMGNYTIDDKKFERTATPEFIKR